jgi:long-subunit fatty acid transport protein
MLKQHSQGNLFGPNMNLNVEAEGTQISPNFAVHFKANNELALSAHYRAATDTTLTGKAQVVDGIDNYDGPVKLNILTPATLRLSGAYQFDKTLVELVASRVFWSALDTAQLQFNRQLTGPGALYQAQAVKNWRDTDTLHLGVTHQYNDTTSLRFGLSQDLGLAAPESSINFDWLDAKVTSIGLGLRHQYSKSMALEAAYNLSHYAPNHVNNTVIQGDYERNVHVLSLSVNLIL